MPSADDFIRLLGLTKHVEGGSFRRVYESKMMITPGNPYDGQRHVATSIYFLLEGNDFSEFHRLKSDETWSFNYGSSLTIYLFDNNKKLQTIVLGDPKSAVYQTTIPANHWFAAEVNDKSSFTLMSCFVSPGFEYADFELVNREVLINQYPAHAELINRLTRR